jgi:cyclopropane-fatty-acyl-phospholipid synthase
MWEQIVKNLFKKANIELDKDIIIHDKSTYRDIIIKGSLGLGESFMKKKWDSPQLDVFIAKILRAGSQSNLILGALIHFRNWVKSSFLNLQNQKYAPDLAETHYNAGNYLFKSFLDSNMIYTCGYFKNTTDLKQAQLNKIKIVGSKLNLQPGESVLDIGCGWGGTARIISETFDVEVTGVTDSVEMVKYANKHNSSEKVQFINSDYRNIKGKYNKIYNVGFLEAVGPKNYRAFMELVNNLLYDNGVFLTHTIGGMHSVNSGDPWLDKYIFPHGVLPSKDQIKKAISNLFDIRDFEAFGKYYATTLSKWSNNLNKNWHTIQDKFDNPEEFRRMMDFYFQSCKAAFQSKIIDLWQYVFTKPGMVSDYKMYRLP